MEFIAFFLILASILWLIKKTSSSRSAIPKPPLRSFLSDSEFRLLANDKSQTTSYNPDLVLWHLLLEHPEILSKKRIKRVLADCIPHDEVRLKRRLIKEYGS